MDSTIKKTAVAILNWNGKQHMETFLPSVLAYSDEAEIYVIDNCSTDDSVTFLETTYPQIKVIQNDQNYGFAGGYNEGLKSIHEPYVVLLNSDVEVTANWLSPLIDELEQYKDVVAVQPKILSYQEKTAFEYAGAAGGYMDRYGYTFCKGRIIDHMEKDQGQYNEACDIFWASGACLVIRNEAFKSVQGFDQVYFAHHEEIDLCWRLINKGHRIRMIPESTVFHLGGGSLAYGSPRKTFLNFRNSLFTLLKNHPKKRLFSTLFIRMLLDGVAVFFFLFKKEPMLAKQVLLAHKGFYKHFVAMYKKRTPEAEKGKYPSFNQSIIMLFYLKGIKRFSDIKN